MYTRRNRPPKRKRRSTHRIEEAGRAVDFTLAGLAAKDLAMWVWEEFRVSVQTMVSRILRALGYRKLSARPPSPERSGLEAAGDRALAGVCRRARGGCSR